MKPRKVKSAAKLGTYVKIYYKATVSKFLVYV